MIRHAQSFPPLVSAQAKVLILGSLPGQASLQQQQYYAHPRNAFWWVMEELLGIQRDAPYAQRCEQLMQAGVALWDVCASAERPGSLDAAIHPQSVVVNDIVGLLTQYPEIQHVYFNGAAAATLFKKHLANQVGLPTTVLPSTSPAHAGLSLEQKIAAWRVIMPTIETL